MKNLPLFAPNMTLTGEQHARIKHALAEEFTGFAGKRKAQKYDKLRTNGAALVDGFLEWAPLGFPTTQFAETINQDLDAARQGLIESLEEEGLILLDDPTPDEVKKLQEMREEPRGRWPQMCHLTRTPSLEAALYGACQFPAPEPLSWLPDDDKFRQDLVKLGPRLLDLAREIVGETARDPQHHTAGARYKDADFLVIADEHGIAAYAKAGKPGETPAVVVSVLPTAQLLASFERQISTRETVVLGREALHAWLSCSPWLWAGYFPQRGLTIALAGPHGSDASRHLLTRLCPEADHRIDIAAVRHPAVPTALGKDNCRIVGGPGTGKNTAAYQIITISGEHSIVFIVAPFIDDQQLIILQRILAAWSIRNPVRPAVVIDNFHAAVSNIALHRFLAELISNSTASARAPLATILLLYWSSEAKKVAETFPSILQHFPLPINLEDPPADFLERLAKNLREFIEPSLSDQELRELVSFTMEQDNTPELLLALVQDLPHSDRGQLLERVLARRQSYWSDQFVRLEADAPAAAELCQFLAIITAIAPWQLTYYLVREWYASLRCGTEEDFDRALNILTRRNWVIRSDEQLTCREVRMAPEVVRLTQSCDSGFVANLVSRLLADNARPAASGIVPLACSWLLKCGQLKAAASILVRPPFDPELSPEVDHRLVYAAGLFPLYLSELLRYASSAKEIIALLRSLLRIESTARYAFETLAEWQLRHPRSCFADHDGQQTCFESTVDCAIAAAGWIETHRWRKMPPRHNWWDLFTLDEHYSWRDRILLEFVCGLEQPDCRLLAALVELRLLLGKRRGARRTARRLLATKHWRDAVAEQLVPMLAPEVQGDPTALLLLSPALKRRDDIDRAKLRSRALRFAQDTESSQAFIATQQ